MNKKDLLRKLATQNDLTVSQSEAIYDDLLNILIDEIKNSGEISLAGFGKFKKVLAKERVGRNPKNGEKLTIQAHFKTSFKAFSDLKKQVNA